MKNTAVALRFFMLGEFGYGGKATIEIDGKLVSGMMYGDDECFDCGSFYQYFVSDDGELYKLYYDTDGDTELDCIDYDHPADYEHATIDPDADPDYLSWDDISFCL